MSLQSTVFGQLEPADLMGLPVSLKAKRVPGIALIELPRDRFSYDTMPRCTWQKRPACMCWLNANPLTPALLLLGPVVFSDGSELSA